MGSGRGEGEGMITIWKYEVPGSDWFELSIPADAIVLTVQPQRESVCLWVMVDTDKPQHNRLFRLAGTGHDVFAGKPLSSLLVDYVGTFQLDGGRLVLHLFEAERVEGGPADA